ncbi:MAG: DUF2807 domain-containing protein [Bacteroides sp.]|nr:DUF2807 domain-containing protein [Bacteroides sp.]MCM1389178.1 DUF2807 domain-containing protein [Bacteroides sp.]
MFCKTILSTLIIGLAATSCSSSSIYRMLSHGEEPSENIVTNSYDFTDLKGIDTACGIIVHYTQTASAEPVRAEGPENVIEALEIKRSKDGTLCLRIENGKNFRYRSKEQHANIWIAAPAIADFEASSGGSIIVDGALSLSTPVDIEASSGASVSIASIKATKMELEASSGAHIKISTLSAETIEADASSGAGITIAGGNASYAYFDASSGSSIKASELNVQKGSCSASSGASIKSSIQNAKTDKSSGGSISNKTK